MHISLETITNPLQNIPHPVSFSTKLPTRIGNPRPQLLV